MLVTGLIQGDSYGFETPSLRALGLLGPSRPVAMHESSPWSATGWVAFENLLQESARRADKPPLGTLTGNVWHEPLPLDRALDREPLVKLLGAALAAATVPVSPDHRRRRPCAARAEDGHAGRRQRAAGAREAQALRRRPVRRAACTCARSRDRVRRATERHDPEHHDAVSAFRARALFSSGVRGTSVRIRPGTPP